MLSILTEEPRPRDLAEVPETAPAEPVTVSLEKSEFEIVLGRLQVASVLFLFTVILVIFSAGSYLAGRAVSARNTDRSAPATTPAPAPAPILEATITKAPSPAAVPAKPEPPVFSDPRKGSVYLQVGAVDEGIAALLVAGLRHRGFQSFAAPGPTEKTFRVLVGPLATPDAFADTRDAISRIGLITFVRKYEP
jgi:hypothetical protein